MIKQKFKNVIFYTPIYKLSLRGFSIGYMSKIRLAMSYKTVYKYW